MNMLNTAHRTVTVSQLFY